MLLVDFSSLYGKQTGESNLDADLRGLFRESLMSNAVLFFDECEVAFRSRSMGGGDRLLNSLLTEIERHEGIVFLATNRPHELVREGGARGREEGRRKTRERRQRTKRSAEFPDL